MLKRHAIVLGLLAALARSAGAQTCFNCILNTATPQDAQFNVGTGTVRGTLTVGSLITSNLTVGSLTVTSISGNGSGLTNLTAGNLTGTIAAGRLAGSYSGITGLGAVTAGTWNASPIGTQYGGTGQNFINISTGDLIYFSNIGVMAALPPGSPQQLLQTNGSAAPSWTGSPTINGQNIQNVQTQYLSTGTIPAYVKVDDPSILAVSGSKVQGNISGFAVSVSSPIGIYQLAPGILPFAIPASSMTDSGVIPGTYGANNIVPQITVGGDGRLRSVTNLIIPGVSTATARVDVDNNWQHAQTSISSWTIPSLKVSGTVTAGFLVGDGSGIFNIPTNIVSATGTAAQLAYFIAPHTLVSSGAITLQGTTVRIGNINAPLPTSDVHLVVGNGTRAYNLNPSEDPIYLELASALGAQSMIGYSASGIQAFHEGKTPHNNYAVADDFGAGIVIFERGGTGHVAVGNIGVGEDSIQTPTGLTIYSVLTGIGTAAIQPVATGSNGTLYFNSGVNHWQFSEDTKAYVTLPGLTAQAIAPGAIPYFSVANGTYLTNDLTLTTSTLAGRFTAVGVSTAAIETQLAADEVTIGALGVSTAALLANFANFTPTTAMNARFDLVGFATASLRTSLTADETTIAALNVSTIAIQAQVNAIDISSASIQAQINALDVSTAALQSQINVIDGVLLAVGVSTASLQSQINTNVATLAAVGTSTASLQTQLTNVGSSTNSLQSQITVNGSNISILQSQMVLVGASTQTIAASVTAETAARLAAQNLIGASTASLQIQLTNVGTSTNSLQVQLTNVGSSTNSLQAQLVNVGVSTNSLQTQLTNVGSSTNSLQAQLVNVGVSTADLQTQLINVGASTGSLQVQLTNVGASTQTLYMVRASSGNNSDITNLNAVSTMNVAGQAIIGKLCIGQQCSPGYNVDLGTSPIESDGYMDITGSATVQGAGGLGVTYGITAASITVTSSVTGNHFGNGSGLTNIHNSSCTTILNTTFTNTSFGPAISTITISNVNSGSRLRVTFAGVSNNSAGGATTNGVTLLLDGAFTSTIGNAAIIQPTTAAGTGNFNFGFDLILDADSLSPGTHNVAFAPDVSAGTGTLVKSATANNRFCVTEER